MPLDNIFADPQAQTCSDIFLGGDEWFEQPRANLRCNTGTVVDDRETHSLPTFALHRTSGGDTNSDSPVLVDRIDAVAEQVCQELANFSRDSEDLGIAFHLGLDRNALIANS